MVVALSGCIGDKSASLTVPAPLAVGAYGPVGFGDTCAASKADLCSTETLQRLESITVEPPGMLEIVPVDQVPADLQSAVHYETSFAAHGLAAGSGRVCLTGLFSDGSLRQSCAPATVADIAHVSTSLSCGQLVGGVEAEPLVPPGAKLSFQVQLEAADGTPLSGDLLHPIDDSGLVGAARNYVWSAPPEGGALTFGSPLDPSFSQTLATYGPTDVTAIRAATDPSQPPLILSAGQGMNYYLAADIGGRRACAPPAITVRVEDPAVCTGDQGVSTWVETSGGPEAWFTAVSEGTCQLTFGVQGGGPALGKLEVSYYLIDRADDFMRDQSAGDGCGDPDLHVCSRDRASVLVCRSKKWAVASACSPGICDYTAPASDCPTSGCAACR